MSKLEELKDLVDWGLITEELLVSGARPAQEAVFDHDDQGKENDRHRGRHDDRRVEPIGLIVEGGLYDQSPKALVGADPLADDRADDSCCGGYSQRRKQHW